MTLEEKLNSRDFYELCPQYRWSMMGADEFEAIKDYLLTDRLPWPSHDKDTEMPA